MEKNKTEFEIVSKVDDERPNGKPLPVEKGVRKGHTVGDKIGQFLTTYFKYVSTNDTHLVEAKNAIAILEAFKWEHILKGVTFINAHKGHDIAIHPKNRWLGCVDCRATHKY